MYAVYAMFLSGMETVRPVVPVRTSDGPTKATCSRHCTKSLNPPQDKVLEFWGYLSPYHQKKERDVRDEDEGLNVKVQIR